MSLASHALFQKLAVALALVKATEVSLFGGGRRLTLSQRELRARAALAGLGSVPYSVGGQLGVVSCDERDGVVLRFAVRAAQHNFLASTHGGCIATCVHVASTVALAASGAFPGECVSLDVVYLAGCGHDAVVRVEARVRPLRAGLALTECVLRRESDSVVMARGALVRCVRPPLLLRCLLALRPSLLDLLLLRELGRGGSVALSAPTRVAFDAETEPDTGLSRDDVGKREYFARYGDGAHKFQGWDGPLNNGLRLLGAPPSPDTADAAPVAWELTVADEHADARGALHAGCTASLVDVLGSALVAMGDPFECGVAIALDTQFATPAVRGEVVRFEAKTLKRGGKLVTVQVEATGENGRLVAVGTVTKSLRGLKKKAAAAPL